METGRATAWRMENKSARYIYRVAQRDDGRYGARIHNENPGFPPVWSSAVPVFDTEEEAINALSGYAIKVGMKPVEDGEPENMDQVTLADAAGDPKECPQDSLNTNDPEDMEAGEERGPEYDEADGDASGDAAPADDDTIPAGEPVSLRDAAFREIVDACDSKINSALKVMLESHQRKFEFTAKVTFEMVGGSVEVTHETGYKFEPINYKDKQTMYEGILIVLDESGRPVIPYDRERQLTMDDVVSEDSAGMTVTTDASGVVEDIRPDDPGETASAGESEHPCETIDCPYWYMGEAGDGACAFDDIPHQRADVKEAVCECGCGRESVVMCYQEIAGNEEGISHE